MLVYSVLAMLVFPDDAIAMHIMEGFLPAGWAGFWTAIALPFLVLGIRSINRTVSEKPRLKMLLGMVAAFAFVLSALKIPSITGSSSHMTGIGLGAILFGPMVMSVLGCIVLLFQAILLAHGGLTTLGANTFSMAIAGPIIAYAIYASMKRAGAPAWLCVFLGAAMGDLATYLVTSAQLALAVPAATGGFLLSFEKFAAVFAITQIPLAVSEGILTVLILNLLTAYSGEDLKSISVLRGGASSR
ncbi:MAG: energy-coupling factor ABC transporter permease [Bacillota bacterium]